MSMFDKKLSILPHNSTPFERTLEQATSFPHLPISELADLINPQAIDARYLPWLAYRFAIEIWNDDWREERKRSVIARALELQRIKGTVRGLREYVKLVDARVQQIVTPPQYFWAGAGLTKQEIDAWHETLPQIRIYFAKNKYKSRFLSFVGAAFAGHKMVAAAHGLGRALYGRQARLWDGRSQEAWSDEATTGNGNQEAGSGEATMEKANHETPLKLIEFQATSRTGQAVRAERVSISGLAGRSFFVGSFVDARFCQAEQRAPQILTWNADITYHHPSMVVSTTSVSPSLQPLGLRVKRKSHRWQDQYCFALGRFTDRFFLISSRADERLYDCLALHDPKRVAPKMRALSFLNVSKLGSPAFHAKTLIDLQMKRQSRAFFVDDGILGYHVAVADDATKREGVRRAVVLSKAVRDKILVSHQTSRLLTFSDAAPFVDGIKFNARVKNRI